MATRLQSLLNLRSRRNPEGLLKEAYASLQENESIQYLVGAMEAVESSYTKKTFEEGDRVVNQTATGLEGESITPAEYKYQGSVTKNTHIKAYSDLDLLVLDGRFVTLQNPQQPANPYKGDPLQDLLQIRSICISHLGSAFPKAKVDDSWPRAVKISGGSLARTIDVVCGNWYNTNDYAEKKHKVYRGVQILNAHKPDRETEQPFIHGLLIDYKDNNTIGNTRKLIRLLKSLKYDSDGRADMSSYDIESLIYRMADPDMQKQRGEEVILAHACWIWLRTVENNQQVREDLSTPDAKRKIFTDGKTTLAQLTALRKELEQLLYEVEQGLKRSFRKLAEARVKWPS
jgi:hypothetical protein